MRLHSLPPRNGIAGAIMAATTALVKPTPAHTFGVAMRRRTMEDDPGNGGQGREQWWK
jgi:hypothetical protein